MEILRLIVYTLAIGGSILCFVNHKKLPEAFLWVGAYLAFAGFSQLTGFLLGRNAISNIAFYNIITVVYTAFIYLIYYRLSDGKKTRLWLHIVFAVGITVISISVIQSLQVNEFSIRALLICSFTAVIGALIGLYGKIKNPLHIAPMRMGWLWVLMGFLFYYSSTFSYWVAYSFTQNLFKQSTLLLINVILVVIFYAILLSAILIQLKFGNQNNLAKPRKSRKSDSLIR